MAAWVPTPWWLGDGSFPLADTALEAERPEHSALLGPDGRPLAYAPRPVIGFDLRRREARDG